MNPGYLSWIMISIVMILLVSGWKYELVRNMPNRVLWIFFGGFFLLYALNASFLFILFIGVLTLAKATTWDNGMITISGAILVGVIHFLLSQFFDVHPQFPLYNGFFQVSLPIILIVVLLFRGVLPQVAGISLALSLSFLLHQYVNGIAGIPFSDVRLQDEWWLTLVLARIISEVILLMSKLLKSVLSSQGKD